MILKDSLYSIQSLATEEGAINAQLALDPEHPIFAGHFPGNPVTPGVVQVEMVQEILSVTLDKEVSLKSMANCKFLAVLNPNVHSSIGLKITTSTTEENTLRVSAQLFAEEVVFTKIQAEFIEVV